MGCMANTPVETPTEETTIELSSETTTEPTKEETTTETTEVCPVEDGIYLLIPHSIDKDQLGCTADLSNYYYESDTDQICKSDIVAENIHIKLSENLYIFDSLELPQSDEIHQAYLDGFRQSYTDGSLIPILWEDEAIQTYLQQYPESIEYGVLNTGGFRYRTIEDFVYTYNELSVWGVGTSILAVVENGVITEMYLNSDQHQAWRYIDAEGKSKFPDDTDYSQYKIQIGV